MLTKKEQALEELKEIRLQLFRNAANLDMIIYDIENHLDEHNQEWFKMFICCNQTHRDNYNVITEYAKLIHKEEEAWKHLINSIE